MKEIKSVTSVKEIPQYHSERVYNNTIRNTKIVEYYQKLLVEGIIKKRLSSAEILTMKRRIKRLEDCNKFWSVEIYKTNQVKILMRTFLCKDKFCSNCNQAKKLVLQNRFLPYLEKSKDFLYHIVLTAPDCTGQELQNTIHNMTRCFKTLITYFNGNKKVKGVNLIQYEFQGCIRSLEITYKGNLYHPHFHVAAVFKNGNDIENKHISNQFSATGKRLFSDFESTIQRMWWLLLNQQRLTSYNILSQNNTLGRYSCVIDKFRPNDYSKLFGYMTKMYSEDNRPMTYANFKILYQAMSRVRQIQGYGIFYNSKELIAESYTEQEFETMEKYLLFGEQPVKSYEPLSRIVDERNYVLLKQKTKNKV